MSNFTRQLDIIDPAKLIYPVTCIGLGGIGSFTAVTLRRMGFKSFTLFDDDIVDSHNTSCQHYSDKDLGRLKVDAMRDYLMGMFSDDAKIEAVSRRFTESNRVEGIVVSGVDDMEQRKNIWRAVRNCRSFVPLYVDGRIGIDWDDDSQSVSGEFVEVLSIRPAFVDDVEFYAPFLFSDDEAAGMKCTAQNVVYIGNLISAFIASNIKKWICRNGFRRHIMFDLLTLDMLSDNIQEPSTTEC